MNIYVSFIMYIHVFFSDIHICMYTYIYMYLSINRRQIDFRVGVAGGHVRVDALCRVAARLPREEPETPDPKPGTLNPKLSTLITQYSTLNLKPYTLNPKP